MNFPRFGDGLRGAANLFERVDLTRLLEFLHARSRPDGGFSSFPTLPTTIADTYFALDLLIFLRQVRFGRELDELIFRDRTREYLAHCLKEMGRLTVRLRFFLFKLALLFDLDPAPLLVREGEESQGAEERYYMGRLGLQQPERRLGPPLTGCRQVMFALKCGDLYPESFRKQLVAWIRLCQNGDGGFGFYPHTTSYIENSCFSLNSLDMLGTVPADFTAALRFICSCQTRCGGFSRNIKAAPFLDASWYAIQALQALQRLSPSD